MVSRLRPLDVNLVFEDRPYKLGETINLTMELTPRGDVEVREGRVDLMCEERWQEVSTVMVPVSWGGHLNQRHLPTGFLNRCTRNAGKLLSIAALYFSRTSISARII